MATFDYNPITGQLDLVGSGGGTSYIDGEVEYHSNLGIAVGSPAVNSAFLVRKGEGLYFISRKPAGIWVRELNNGNLDDWKYAGTFSDLYRDANFRILNNADVSKELAFDVSGITTGTTRTLTAPNASGTIALTTTAPASHTHGNLTNDGKIGTTANLPLKTGTNGVIEAGSFGTAAGSFCEGDDARLSDARTPSSTLAHKASHATGGTDALAPSDIGAQSLFTAVNVTSGVQTSPHQLSALRAQAVRVAVNANFTIRLPETGHQSGDIVEIRAATLSSGATITIERGVGPSFWTTLATITSQGGKLRLIANGTGRSDWEEDAYFTTNGAIGAAAIHTHVVADVTGAAASGSITTSGLTQATARILGRTSSGTGAIEEIQIGSGLSLSAGELSSTVSAGIPATLLDAKGDLIVASAADTAARLAVGGTNGHVLTVDSAETLGVKWAAAAASNMTGATASTAGTAGLVPQPAAGQEEMCLFGSGQFHLPSFPVVKVETTRGLSNTRRWLVPPLTQEANAGVSSPAANFEIGGGYVYIPYTGSYFYATVPAAAYSTNTKTCWGLYNLASDGLPATLAYDLGELDVGAGSNVICESANSTSLNRGWYFCIYRANGAFNLWSPQSTAWQDQIIGRVTINSGSGVKRRFYRSLTYSTSLASDLTSTTFSEDTGTPPNLWFRRA